MLRVRAWAVSCLAVLAAAGTACAQFERTAKYTELPVMYSEEKALREQGQWLVKVFADPVTAAKDEGERLATLLDKPSYEIPALQQSDASALRAEIASIMVEKARMDPMFEAVVTIARMNWEDRGAAAQAAAMFCNAVRAYAKQFPAAAEVGREILLTYLKDSRAEIRYLAVVCLADAGNPPGGRTMTEALLGFVNGDDAGMAEAAVSELAQLGDVSAVRPLMEKFLALPVDGATMADETASSGGGTPGTPLNQLKFEIAIAVGRLTGVDRFGDLSALYNKERLLAVYDDLAKWWEANKGNYSS